MATPIYGQLATTAHGSDPEQVLALHPVPVGTPRGPVRTLTLHREW